MKTMIKRLRLTQAVLASCVFVAPFCYATQFGGNVTTNGPIFTSANGGIVEVLATGQIQGDGVNAVNLNTPGGQVITDPNNTFAGSNAIFITAGGGTAIGVNVTAANGSILVGEGSGIQSLSTNVNSPTILITAPGTNVTNSGIISSTVVGSIKLTSTSSALGIGTNITNDENAIITSTTPSTGATIIVDSGTSAPGLTLSNSGIIQVSNGDVIQTKSPFVSMSNSGIIQQTNALNAGNAINAAVGTSAGDITNNLEGVISVAGSGNAIVVASATTGNIFNAGTIKSNTNSTLAINSNMTSASGGIFNIDNSGTLQGTNLAAGQAVILLGAGATLASGIVNSGDILNSAGVLTSNAVDLSAGSATLTQNDGSIQGNVLLSGGGGNVFVMNGGTINGNVTASNVASTLVLNGGIVNGAVNGGTANDIFNVTGGSFTSLNGGTGADTLNINATYASTGTINNIQTININNSGTLFTLNQAITGMTTQLTVNAGTEMIANANISGAGGKIVNNGQLTVNGAPSFNLGAGFITNNNGSTFKLNPGAAPTIIAGAFTNSAGSNLDIEITSPSIYGKMTTTVPGANNVSFATGSFIRPHISGFIPQGATFNIVTDNGAAGTIFDDSTIVQPSTTITFAKSLIGVPGNNILQLIANRNSFTIFSGTSVNLGIAGALNSIAAGNGITNPTLFNLISQFDTLNGPAAIAQAMESLTPPFNYGLIAGSFAGMDMMFDQVQDRMENFHATRQRRNNAAAAASTGLNNGDTTTKQLGTWVSALGANLNQDDIDNVAGYNANAGGLAIGGDWDVQPCMLLGFGISYVKANIDDNAQNPKDETIHSWQTTAYTSLEFTHGIFIDALIGLATNHYQLNRNIAVNQLFSSASAFFQGIQYGAQVDIGTNLLSGTNYELSPFARIKYIGLNIEDYTEDHAGDLSLKVSNSQINNSLLGVGLIFSTGVPYGRAVWEPYLSALVGYLFENDGEETAANFVGGGPIFVTDGITPGPTVFDFGVGMRASMGGHAITAKYRLELRDEFASQSGYLQYYYLWS